MFQVFLETWFQFQNLYLLNIPLSFQKLLVYFINLIVLEMIFYLMVCTTLVYKTILLIVQCMFTLALKIYIINEDSSIIWNQRFRHISIKRIKILVNDTMLSTLDFINFETCVYFIKRKQTNKSNKDVIKSSNILEITHTNIYLL